MPCLKCDTLLQAVTALDDIVVAIPPAGQAAQALAPPRQPAGEPPQSQLRSPPGAATGASAAAGTSPAPGSSPRVRSTSPAAVPA